MRYIRGDVLTSNRSITHCVSADFAMGKGIAKTITDRYGRAGLNTAPLHRIGWKQVGNRYILYLVTKETFRMKPTLTDMRSTLINLRILCLNNSIIELAMPRIGCGLDQLSWPDVEKLVITELENYGISVDVYIE